MINNNNELIPIAYSPDGDCSYTFSIANYININTSNILIGSNVTNISYAYYNCRNLTESPICGSNVVDMSYAYRGCYNLTGNPVCGNNVTDMRFAYCYCDNVTGSPMCGEKVINMYYTYTNCHSLTGSPTCGNNVINMSGTYRNCRSLTGTAACGKNVTDMSFAYANCYYNLTTAACGENVINMAYAYSNCKNLTTAACGANVINMTNAYPYCYHLRGNGYFYSNKVNSVRNCFIYKDNSKILNLYVPSTGYNSTHNTLATCLINNTYSLVGANITWSPIDYTSSYSARAITTNKAYYNTSYNIYIIPVDDVSYVANSIANGTWSITFLMGE